MFQEILACIDGSSLAEKVLPVARAITAPRGGRVTLLRVVPHTDALAREEEHLRDCTRRYGAELRLRVSPDPAQAIVAELGREPRAIAALTTHGRTAWVEAVMGTVALHVIREAKRPVIVFCPLDQTREAPKQIKTVALTLDGSAFSERMIPYAVKATQYLAARLVLIQALPVHQDFSPIAAHEKSDILESSYLHRKAGEIKVAHGIDVDWEVLHGDPAEAICRYLSDVPESLLAMTTHARSGLERAVLGSVAGACLRRAGVPLLLYWPHR